MTRLSTIKTSIEALYSAEMEQAIRDDYESGKSRKAARTNAIGLLTNRVRDRKSYQRTPDMWQQVIENCVDVVLAEVYGPYVSSVLAKNRIW